LEVTSSVMLVKFPNIKKYISTRPTTLIKNGKLLPRQMQKVRLTADELISELRQNGILGISEVQYAILEQNGKISVIPKPKNRPLTAKDMNVTVSDSGLYHIMIENGQISEHGLSESGFTREKLDAFLAGKGLSRKDIYIMMRSDAGDIEIIKKEKK
ncbi:MAG: DUF421 domain-containing protein, partial [Clostridia bacterium]|nr:DUF421 domain-containing protein [Clostridia bacterium]